MRQRIADKDIIPHIDKRIAKYRGQAGPLEQAIGAWVIGRKFGWKVMLLMHDRKTLAKYEDILGIKFREELDEFGPQADRTLAYKALKKVTNFWKAVRGEVPDVKSAEIR